MPLREYECLRCRNKVESLEYGDEPYFVLCVDCGEPMRRVEFSVPARTRVGKYGKAGGLPPEGQ